MPPRSACDDCVAALQWPGLPGLGNTRAKLPLNQPKNQQDTNIFPFQTIYFFFNNKKRLTIVTGRLVCEKKENVLIIYMLPLMYCQPVPCYRKVAGLIPLVCMSYIYMETQTAPEVLVGTLHGSHHHQYMNVCMYLLNTLLYMHCARVSLELLTSCTSW